MALDFPSNPSNGDTYVSGGVTFTWDGTSWVAASIITESDPVFNAHAASNVTTQKISNWDTAHTWGDHSGNYLANNHPASTVTTTKQANWDTAYGWGNHTSGGYLTDLGTAIVDADFGFNGLMKRGTTAGSYSVVTDNSQNWNSAYGWGNHAAAGYLSGVGGQPLAALSNVSNTAANEGEVLAWVSASNEWQPQASVAFPSGTKMLFQQTTPQVGWTKITDSTNNRALRIVSGSVGSGGDITFLQAFSSTRSPAGTVSANVSVDSATAGGSCSASTISLSVDNQTVSGTVNGTTLTTSQIPSHQHSFSGSISGTTDNDTHNHGVTDPEHYHNVAYSNSDSGDGVIEESGTGLSGYEPTEPSPTFISINNDTHSHGFSGSVSGTTGAEGSSTSHNHSFSGGQHSHGVSSHSHSVSFSGTSHTHDTTVSGLAFAGSNMNFAVQYIDVIIASKD